MSNNKDWLFRDVQYSKQIQNLSLWDPIVTFYNTTDPASKTFVLQSIFGNLLYEIIIFLCVAFLFFFYFSSVAMKSKLADGAGGSKLAQYLTWGNLVQGVKKFSYYFWFLLFYASLYLISKGIPMISFSVFLLILNIAIYIFFFTSKFSILSRDLLKINSLLFSFGYVICFFVILVSGNNFFWWADFINSLLTLFIYPTLLYYNMKIENQRYLDHFMVTYFSFYVVVLFLFYTSLFLSLDVGFWLVILLSIFGVVWVEYLPKIEILKNNAILLKYIGIIFSYIWVIGGVLYLLWHFSWIIFLLLFLQIGYHIFIHIKYISFVSYTVAILLWIFLFYYTLFYFSILDLRSTAYFIVSLILSFSMVFLTYGLKFRMPREIYILHMTSYGVNFFSVVIFFIFHKFEILYIWIMLFLESIFFFLSYNKLNKGTKKEVKH